MPSSASSETEPAAVIAKIPSSLSVATRRERATVARSAGWVVAPNVIPVCGSLMLENVRGSALSGELRAGKLRIRARSGTVSSDDPHRGGNRRGCAWNRGDRDGDGPAHRLRIADARS